MDMQRVSLICTLFLGATFLLSSASKLRDPHGFVIGVLDYDVLPRWLAVAYGRLLPFVELICGILLLLGLWQDLMSLIVLAMLASFAVAIVVTLERGRQLDCHCFSSDRSEPVGWQSLIRIAVLAAASLIVLVTPGMPTTASWSANDLLAAASAAGGMLLLMLMLRAVPVLQQTWRRRSEPAPTPHGGRISLRGLPLAPLESLMIDRSQERSGCDTCNGQGAVHPPKSGVLTLWPRRTEKRGAR